MKLFLVDDDKAICRSLSKILIKQGHQVSVFNNGFDAFEAIKKEPVHLVISDIQMDRMTGFELLKKIKQHPDYRDIVVILFTGFGNIIGAVDAMKIGAYNYLLKPVNIDELILNLEKAGEYLSLKKENTDLTENFEQKLNESTIEIKNELNSLKNAFSREVGTANIGIFSEKLKNVFKTAEKLHNDPVIPVLLEGETGTGKEIVARYIHYGNSNVTTPFVDMNCAAISPGLFESELFGYEAGAFTGGNPKGAKGKIELADGGSIFLDEITEMPIEYQAKLLRLLQERTYYRVGGLKKLTANVRFICATNQYIEKKVEKGSFRKDLFFRLNVGQIRIPPLRERKEAILPLAEMFLEDISKKKMSRFRKISGDASAILKDYNWPGNVRELQNCIEKAVLLYDDTEIKPEHIRFLSGESKRPENNGINLPEFSEENFPLPERGLDLNRLNLKIVEKALHKHSGNKTDTAIYLGISRKVLYTYLKRLEEHNKNSNS